MSIQLTEGQQKAVKIALDKYEHGDSYVVITGAAGTGKSTVVRFIVDAIQKKYGIPNEDIANVAYTGSASKILSRNGLQNCMTLHKLLYKSEIQKNGRFRNRPVPRSQFNWRLVICDEISFVGQEMISLMLSYPSCFYIFLGDPGQLPSLSREQNHLGDSPDVYLTEIMRQAADSEIIQVCSAIRQGQRLELRKGVDVEVIANGSLTDEQMLWADVIICATNKMRNTVNTRVRQLLGRSGDLVENEQLICLHNAWDTLSDENNEPMTNGTVGTISNIRESTIYYPKYGKFKGKTIEVYIVDFVDSIGETFKDIAIDKQCVLNGECSLDGNDKYNILKAQDKDEDYPELPIEMTYGYCISGHKSQGATFGKVVVVEERFPFDTIEHAKWMYTACSRASDKEVIVLK